MNPSELIDKQIADLADWRGKMLARLRKIIHEANSDIIEEWKWGTAVFSNKGMVCALGAFKDHVKLNFFKSASLKDQQKLFNAGLEAKATRAIDFHENDRINESALKDLIRAAVALSNAKKSCEEKEYHSRQTGASTLIPSLTNSQEPSFTGCHASICRYTRIDDCGS